MTNTRKILIVDDDAELRDAMVEQLALHEEFESVAVDSGSKGVQAAKSGQVDLVIMDVGLPDLDGREAVRILRKNGFKAPIIMLTGHNTDSDTILGLESGANDYVAKPFRFAVLLARIRAQLRQHEASEDAVFTIGPYTFRPSSKILLNQKGNKVRLTEKETAILRHLYRAGQRPVSRETLLQEVWGYNSGTRTRFADEEIARSDDHLIPGVVDLHDLERQFVHAAMRTDREAIARDQPQVGERHITDRQPQVHAAPLNAEQTIERLTARLARVEGQLKGLQFAVPGLVILAVAAFAMQLLMPSAVHTQSVVAETLGVKNSNGDVEIFMSTRPSVMGR